MKLEKDQQADYLKNQMEQIEELKFIQMTGKINLGICQNFTQVWKMTMA